MNIFQQTQDIAFGELLVDQRANSHDIRYKFTGKERDAATGLDYFGARYYMSDLSVWLSIDPKSDEYASTSPYMYVLGNPIRIIDPNGEDGWDVMGGLTTTGGVLMWTGGVALASTGVGTPAGVYLIMGGSVTIGLGVAQMIDGAANDGAHNIPSGPAELSMVVGDKIQGNSDGELRKYGAAADLLGGLLAGGIPKPKDVEGVISAIVTTNSARSTAKQFIETSEENTQNTSNSNSTDNTYNKSAIKNYIEKININQVDNTNVSTPKYEDINIDIDVNQ